MGTTGKCEKRTGLVKRTPTVHRVCTHTVVSSSLFCNRTGLRGRTYPARASRADRRVRAHSRRVPGVRTGSRYCGGRRGRGSMRARGIVRYGYWNTMRRVARDAAREEGEKEEEKNKIKKNTNEREGKKYRKRRRRFGRAAANRRNSESAGWNWGKEQRSIVALLAANGQRNNARGTVGASFYQRDTHRVHHLRPSPVRAYEHPVRLSPTVEQSSILRKQLTKDGICSTVFINSENQNAINRGKSLLVFLKADRSLPSQRFSVAIFGLGTTVVVFFPMHVS